MTYVKYIEKSYNISFEYIIYKSSISSVKNVYHNTYVLSYEFLNVTHSVGLFTCTYAYMIYFA